MSTNQEPKRRRCTQLPLRISAIIIGGLQVVLNAGEIVCAILDVYYRTNALTFGFGIVSIVVSGLALLLGIFLVIGILKENILLVKIWQCLVLFVVVLALVVCCFVVYLLIKIDQEPLHIIWLLCVSIFIVVACTGIFIVNHYILVKVAEQDELMRQQDIEEKVKKEREKQGRHIRRMQRE